MNRFSQRQRRNPLLITLSFRLGDIMADAPNLSVAEILRHAFNIEARSDRHAAANPEIVLLNHNFF